mgnify:CR=1 FL=1|tara:strand:+ start:635 stop:1774 length:1140 start_codon:yes stop_codon:yes gene_type:complete
MILASDFIEEGKKRNFLLYTGVPCSYLKPFINYVIDSPDIEYIGAANEGEGVAIAAGATLAGINSVVMFQNSGLGNAVNPITSLIHTFKIPSLIITTLRGEPNGPKDEPQHELMGKITTSLLDLMEVEWQFFPENKKDINEAYDKALKSISNGKPYALVMKKGSVKEYKLKKKPLKKEIKKTKILPSNNTIGTRAETLEVIQKSIGYKDLLIATTGYTGRELYALEDKENQLYTVGSMGCASSIGLGISLFSKKSRVIILDGDGAVLMRMGALATIGYYRPNNFLHILLNNELHESTGGQSTVSHSTDFLGIAQSCGYQDVKSCSTIEELESLISNETEKLTFCLLNIKPGVMDNLPRPVIKPYEVAKRFKNYIRDNHD